MNRYIVFNVGMLLITILMSIFFVKSKKQFIICLKVSIIITVIGLPWDFFAIAHGVWTYPEHPGVRLLGVPINDLVFIFLCSFISCSIISNILNKNR